ncbi:uncharacterized protein [Zea mays]|uniref:Serine-rich protein n=1 Tax=Zea mays TaxID=4577 RepID=A0A1D6HNJ6_MAIZE|nr:uncharacterized protein LOC103627864 [Zea mays]AQK75866.1 hypothetical protein ZEAMMB73_Zm00001d018400 [Zea mays]|eukprot:XP_008646399.1 uncharacterized protein LOC103627864 [Zea mays]
MASAPCSNSSPAARAPRSAAAGNKKPTTCLCSPTSHPGSFRCSRHRNGAAAPGGEAAHGASRGGTAGRAAKGRSVRALLLQRIGGGPSELGGRRRRCRRGVGDFQPRPSRLRLMNQ